MRWNLLAGPPVLAAAVLLGCAGAAPPPPGAASPDAQGAEPTSSGAAEPGASNTSAPPSASSDTAAAPPQRAAELPRAEPPAPLTEAEQKEAQSKCKPLLDAMQSAGKDDGKSPPERLRAVVEAASNADARPGSKKSLKMSPADLSRCADLLGRGMRGYLFAAFEVEAKAILGRLARGMVGAYQEAGAFCPSTDRPVPADAAKVARAAHESAAADWDAPAWKCLHFSMEGQPLRFQYEVRTDPKALTFELIARGSPERDGKFVELVQRGAVKGGRVEVEGAVRR